jgi:hypothetical protein
VVAVAAIQVAIQGSLVARGEDYVVTSLVYDDAFYYLAVAWNLHALGFFTFDGLHATNGVQFLWFWILAAVAAVTPTKAALLMAAMWITVALNALAHLPMLRLARALGRPSLAPALALALLYLNLSDVTYLLGMENSLHLAVLVLLVAVLAETLVRADRQAMTAGDLVKVAALLGLATWVRLDSAIYVAPLYAYAAWLLVKRSRTGPLAGVLASAALAGGMAALMFAGNALMAGTVLPISGLVKQATFNEGFAAKLVEVAAHVLRQTSPLFRELVEAARSLADGKPVRADALAWTLAAAAAIGGAWLVLELRRARSAGPRSREPWLPERRAAVELAAVLSVTVLPHFLYVSSYPHFMAWYHSPELLLGTLATGLAVHRIGWLAVAQARAARAADARPRGAGRGAVLAAGATAMVAAVLLTVWSLSRNGIFTHERSRDYAWQVALYRERLALARWADRHLPRDAVLAAWNAGILGYYANRTLINLDGLVNDEAFYHEVLGDRRLEALPRYLEEHGVSLVLDRTLYDYRLPDFVKVPLPQGFAQMEAYRNRNVRLDLGTLEAPGAPGVPGPPPAAGP